MTTDVSLPNTWHSKTSFYVAVSVGILALLNLILGWGLGLEFFLRIWPEYPAMVPSTAISLLFGSLGLIALNKGYSPWVARLCSVLIASDVIANYRLAVFQVVPDGMSIATAIACLLIAVCLWSRTVKDLSTFARLLPKTLGVSLAMVPLIGYLYNSEALFANPVYTLMALHTAIGFTALFVAFLVNDAEVGWMRVLAAPELGSQMLRKLLPFLVLVPVGLTGLALIASNLNYVSADLRASVLAYTMILMLVTAACYFANVINKTEQRAAQAEKLQRESDRARQVAEVALERGQKIEALGKLVGGVAHDFNNTLSVVLGNLQLLQADPDKSAHPVYLTEAVEAVQNAAELTRQLLAYGRKSRLEPVPVNLDDLVRKTLNMFQRLCPANITVSTRLSANEMIVELDPINFQQALLNILINARDAQPQGGKIVISTAAEEMGREQVSGFGGTEQIFSGTFVCISVVDSGPGMTAQELSRATEPFFTTKPVGEGTGLGLSVASGFCRQSGGGLTLLSEPGHGLTAKMFFPLSPSSPDVAPETMQQSTEVKPSAHRILLVDDDEKVTRVMARQLQLDGNEVEVALSAADALEIMSTGPAPDLVITDLVMPGAMQGHALAKEIRARFPGTHVVLMSGYDSIRQRQSDGAEWNEPFLQKPINWILLREVAASCSAKKMLA
ncbi:response regulator [Pseudosulfitobacter pseudonitzschiae]|uniref:response regulator n=1 Tax=Pseudosulfitobacter pseudonitzschiae TaxID=1402135 RepID=UPI001AF5423A|nr:response regulator [Pseudosulfitobacter pseudonitzschiae]MBM1816263.1 response regulator [Pseudosulfitobacter pseudonitzschiae]MBM1833776.1 response regulator [Pseudosulfitobacter pseudonitzschiae]MBM1838642.1 response regulator [Pseudosulfitobacter pseudonitzschiae]MBM1842990.1 response regulator [Pseudosulfitobacter pseudonitzschiae]MBM1847856.1 response regulator [Pseudosulfitobacter pseudonitzschiae]